MTPDRLRAVRLRLGLTQAQLAERLGLGKGGGRTVRRWEAGPVPTRTAVAVEMMARELERGMAITTEETR